MKHLQVDGTPICHIDSAHTIAPFHLCFSFVELLRYHKLSDRVSVVVHEDLRVVRKQASAFAELVAQSPYDSYGLRSVVRLRECRIVHVDRVRLNPDPAHAGFRPLRASFEAYAPVRKTQILGCIQLRKQSPEPYLAATYFLYVAAFHESQDVVQYPGFAHRQIESHATRLANNRFHGISFRFASLEP
jgi:hypothetical protein